MRRSTVWFVEDAGVRYCLYAWRPWRSGLDMSRNISDRLARYSRRGRDGEPLPQAPIEVRRIALSLEHRPGNQREAAYEHPAHARRAMNLESKLLVTCPKSAMAGNGPSGTFRGRARGVATVRRPCTRGQSKNS